MILADTSLWIDHFRHGDPDLTAWLDAGQVLMHPFILGELALGNLKERDRLLSDLARLPQAVTARSAEVLALIRQDGLHGLGLGYVDAALLAAVRLTPGSELRTRDRRLQAAAEGMRRR